MSATIAIWLLMLGPFVALVARTSPSRIVGALSRSGALLPLATSLGSSLIVLAVLVVIGTPLGYALARSKRPGIRIIEAGVIVMLLMPPLVVGLLLVFMVGPLTPIGEALSRIHLDATNTFFALMLAEFYEAGPYYVLGAQSAFALLDEEVLEQSSLLGDSGWTRFKRVSLPLSLRPLATSLAVAWARATGAFGAVIIIAYHPYGLPMQIWTTLNEVGLPQALPFALLLVVVALPLPLLAFAWGRNASR